jgi:hypothetical protein
MVVRLATISERDESASESELERQRCAAMLQTDADESDEDNGLQEMLNERKRQRKARYAEVQAAAAAAAAGVLTFDEDNDDTLKQLSNERKQERKALHQHEAEQTLLSQACREANVKQVPSATGEEINKFDEDTLKQLAEKAERKALGNLDELMAEPFVEAIATQVAEARHLIVSSSTPAASAQALEKMGIAVALCPPENRALDTRLKSAENVVRDTAVWRCQMTCAEPGKLVEALSSRSAFVSQLQAVFGMGALKD